MCLTISSPNSPPYRPGNIRWKLARKSSDGTLCAPYMFEEYSCDWMTAEGNENDIERFGFHVLLTREAARNLKHSLYTEEQKGLVIIKCQVKNHLQSGYFVSGQAETWKRMKIIG